MSVSLNTKLVWFDRGAAAFERSFPGAISEVIGPDAPACYVCPICTHGFPRESVLTGDLTEEHVPPKCFRGRGLVLTCRGCNNTSGTELDAHARRKENVAEALRGVHTKRPLRVKAMAGTLTLNAQFTSQGRNMQLKIRPHLNHPETEAAFKTLMKKGTQIQVEYHGDRHSGLAANISWLRSAYLATFAVFGYRVVSDPAMQIVRRQILENDERRMISFLRIFPEALPWTEPRMGALHGDSLAGGWMVQFERYGVMLPGPGDLTFYDRIAAEVERGEPSPATVQLYEWPLAPMFGLPAADSEVDG